MPTESITIRMQPPLTDGGGLVRPNTGPLSEDELVARTARHVEDGHEDVVVDLDDLAAADEEEVKALTSFLWRLRTEGADPVVVCGVWYVREACRALKLDQAFEVRSPGDAP